MKKIIFVCHGSICRSPAAEMIFRKEIKERGFQNKYEVSSLALSNEEIGNPIYPPMQRCLSRHHIEMTFHRARRLTQADLDACDCLFYMDKENEWLLSHLVNDSSHKCQPVYCFTPSLKEIEDPWYSGNYDLVVEELMQCVADILNHLEDR